MLNHIKPLIAPFTGAGHSEPQLEKNTNKQETAARLTLCFQDNRPANSTPAFGLSVVGAGWNDLDAGGIEPKAMGRR